MMGNKSGKHASQGSSDTRHSSSLHNPWPDTVLMKYKMWSCLTEGSKTSKILCLLFTLPSICRRWDDILYLKALPNYRTTHLSNMLLNNAGSSKKVQHLANEHISDRIHMPIAVWGIGGFWTMETMKCMFGSRLALKRWRWTTDTDSSTSIVGPNTLERSCNVCHSHVNKTAVIPCCGHVMRYSTHSSLLSTGSTHASLP